MRNGSVFMLQKNNSKKRWGYCPDNCRWVPLVEQSWNRTNTLRFDVSGVQRNISEFTGGSKRMYNRVRHRILKGCSFADAFRSEGIDVF